MKKGYLKILKEVLQEIEKKEGTRVYVSEVQNINK